MRIEDIAVICHETMRAYCLSQGDDSQPPWNECDERQQRLVIKNVSVALANPFASVAAQHDLWLEDRLREGWTYGLIKDEWEKEDPCCVPYDRLSMEHRLKYVLFQNIVRSFVICDAVE